MKKSKLDQLREASDITSEANRLMGRMLGEEADVKPNRTREMFRALREFHQEQGGGDTMHRDID